MKKTIPFICLALLLVFVFVGCAASETTKGGSLNPLPPPTPPTYTPDPLNVEFFSTSYQGMSNWIKYPNTPTTTTDTEINEELPAEDSAK